MDEPRTLTPTQERILQRLRREPTPVVFPEDEISELVETARTGFAELTARLGGEKLTVGKSMLAGVHGCEAQYLAPSTFEWTPTTAAGFVAHKAIELTVNWRGEPNPADVVEEAIERIADEAGYRGDFVARLTEGERAELRSKAVERTTKYLHDFPPPGNRSDPVLEAALRWRASPLIELTGRPDMMLGRPDGRTSTRLIIDFKTGWRGMHHRADLQFYALIETLIRNVPPRKIVTYYLDEADVDVEDVTIGGLHAALARALDGVALHAELVVDRRPPVKRPGAPCRWCPLQATCTEGRAHLAALDDRGGQGFDDAED